MKNIVSLNSSLMLAGMLAVPAISFGQITPHYPIGAEGIKAASLPPPGLYLRDYNQFYTSDHLRYSGPSGFDVKVYAQVPRLIYMTEFKILGANYGADVIVPFIYTDLKMPNGYKNSAFGLGDVCVEPILLSWHFKKFDLSAAYAIWTPTGEFDLTRPDQPGKGFWGHMFTLGGTYYFDEKKTWAASILNRYEINTEQRYSDITPGQSWTMEWGISKALCKSAEVGVVGYYQLQTTDDKGATAAYQATYNPFYDPRIKDQVAGIGPEISVVIPKVNLITQLRYGYEFGANDRPEGHLFTLVLTKRF